MVGKPPPDGQVGECPLQLITLFFNSLLMNTNTLGRPGGSAADETPVVG
jgi:hypothetical protein